METRWYQPNDKSVVFKDIISIFLLNPKRYKIFIGTDSHEKGNNCIFASVIALYEKGRGGRYFYKRNVIKDYKALGYHNISKRLMKEIEDSVMIAKQVEDMISFKVDIKIHCDINQSPQYKSYKVQKTAIAYITGMGFEPELKPRSWASSCLADSHAR